jgi:hypothetical protein
MYARLSIPRNLDQRRLLLCIAELTSISDLRENFFLFIISIADRAFWLLIMRYTSKDSYLGRAFLIKKIE